MKSKKKVLFVCTVNRMRSRTAEDLYKDDQRFEVQSAGTNSFADRPIDNHILEWADLIVVMEHRHLKKIKKGFPEIYKKKRIVCLDIPDIYHYMDFTLIREIKDKFEPILQEAL